MTQPAVQPDLRHHRPVPVFWWLRKRSYFVFVMRELSSLFIGWLVLYLCLFVRAVGQGEAAYRAHLEWAASPWVVTLDVVALGFVVLHTITWFALTPRAMVVAVRGRPVPGVVVIAVQYAVLAAVSGFVLWLVSS